MFCSITIKKYLTYLYSYSIIIDKPITWEFFNENNNNNN